MKPTINKNSSLLICIGGMPGAGKTTAGLSLQKVLQEKFGLEVLIVDPDQTQLEALELLGYPHRDILRDEDLLDQAANALTDYLMIMKATNGIAAGQIVIVPATFCPKEFRRAFEIMASVHQIPFCGVRIVGSIEKHEENIDKRNTARENGIHNLATISAVSKKKIDPMRFTGSKNWPEIDMTFKTSDEVLVEILRHLPNTDDRRPVPYHERLPQSAIIK